MAFSTPVTRLFDLRYPLLSSPMGSVAGGALAAAVSRAGGLGLIGPGYHDTAWIRREFSEARGAHVGVGFITWELARDAGRLGAALEHEPVCVLFSFGDFARYVPEVRRTKAKVVAQVQTLEQARQARALGADLIVAQGSEAGGHGATRSLFPLLPAVVDAVAPTPVIAAGGIGDGRGLVAALALGAAGAMLGTRLCVASEALTSPEAKERLVRGSGDHTVRTRVFDIVRELAWPEPFTGRALENQFTKRWHGRENELGANIARESDRYAQAAQRNDLDTALVWAGEGVDLAKRVEPAGDIVEKIAGEALSVLSELASSVIR